MTSPASRPADKRSRRVSSTAKGNSGVAPTLRSHEARDQDRAAKKANEVLEALYRAGVRGVLVSRVQGHGGELDPAWGRGTTVRVGMADKVRFEIAVSDEFVEPTIEALCDGSGPVRSATARSSSSGSSRSSASAPARPPTPPSPRWVRDVA